MYGTKKGRFDYPLARFEVLNRLLYKRCCMKPNRSLISRGINKVIFFFSIIFQSETFMDKQNNNSKCKQCQKCPPSQTATRHCKPIHNRECGCPPGTYHDKEVLICLECLKCNVGYGAVSPCTNISNTECQPCREVRVTRLDNLSIVIQLFCFLRRRWTFIGNSALLPSYATNFCDIACSEIAPCGE